MKIRCHVEGCPEIPESKRGAVLHRLNPIGELPSVWSCEAHWPLGVPFVRDEITDDILDAVAELEAEGR